jgi:hypothetical protein
VAVDSGNRPGAQTASPIAARPAHRARGRGAVKKKSTSRAPGSKADLYVISDFLFFGSQNVKFRGIAKNERAQKFFMIYQNPLLERSGTTEGQAGLGSLILKNAGVLGLFPHGEGHF